MKYKLFTDAAKKNRPYEIGHATHGLYTITSMGYVYQNMTVQLIVARVANCFCIFVLTFVVFAFVVLFLFCFILIGRYVILWLKTT